LRDLRVRLADRRDVFFFREPFLRAVFARPAVRLLAVRFLAVRRFLPAARFGAFAFLRADALRDFAFLGRAGRDGLGDAGGGVGVKVGVVG